MINAEIEARELQNKLSHICPDAKIDFKIPTANEAVITIHNPNGGLPINIFSNDFDHEFKVIYFKTPRFFPSNQDGIDALLKAISDYITGKIVYMDIISTSNNSYPRDRLVPVSELPEADLDKLARLCTRICLVKANSALNCKPAPLFVSIFGIKTKISVIRCKTEN